MHTVKFLFVPLILIYFNCFFIEDAHAQIEKQREALKLISDFAGEICNQIPIEGHSNNLELSGEAKTELRGLLKKVANLGVNGKGKYTEEEYLGVLQSELARSITKNADCKFKIFESLKGNMFSVQSSSGSMSGNFEIEPNNDFAQANEISNGVVYSGETDHIGLGRDYFKFSSREGRITVTLDVEDSVRDYKVIVFNKTREVIKLYDVKGGEKKVQTIGVPDGRKFISVGYTGGTHASPYKLSVDY